MERKRPAFPPGVESELRLNYSLWLLNTLLGVLKSVLIYFQRSDSGLQS
jgi:hypothetical protein